MNAFDACINAVTKGRSHQHLSRRAFSTEFAWFVDDTTRPLPSVGAWTNADDPMLRKVLTDARSPALRLTCEQEAGSRVVDSGTQIPSSRGHRCTRLMMTNWDECDLRTWSVRMMKPICLFVGCLRQFLDAYRSEAIPNKSDRLKIERPPPAVHRHFHALLALQALPCQIPRGPLGQPRYLLRGEMGPSRPLQHLLKAMDEILL